jgi:hypothetical protein
MGGVGIKKGECMYDLDKYYPSRYRRLLLNIAHDVLDQYKEKDRGVTDVQSARNTFNIYVYLNNPAVVKDRNYETILDDLLLLIDEDIQNNITYQSSSVTSR